MQGSDVAMWNLDVDSAGVRCHSETPVVRMLKCGDNCGSAPPPYHKSEALTC